MNNLVIARRVCLFNGKVNHYNHICFIQKSTKEEDKFNSERDGLANMIIHNYPHVKVQELLAKPGDKEDKPINHLKVIGILERKA